MGEGGEGRGRAGQGERRWVPAGAGGVYWVPPPPHPASLALAGRRAQAGVTDLLLSLKLTSLKAEGPCAEPRSPKHKEESLAFDVNICSGFIKLDMEGTEVLCPPGPALTGHRGLWPRPHWPTCPGQGSRTRPQDAFSLRPRLPPSCRPAFCSSALSVLQPLGRRLHRSCPRRGHLGGAHPRDCRGVGPRHGGGRGGRVVAQVVEPLRSHLPFI